MQAKSPAARLFRSEEDGQGRTIISVLFLRPGSRNRAWKNQCGRAVEATVRGAVGPLPTLPHIFAQRGA